MEANKTPLAKAIKTTTAKTRTKPNKEPTVLPQDGLSRWSQLEPFSPVAKEKFRQLSLSGKAPQPIRMGRRCTAYRNSELHRWLADPLNYCVEGADDDRH